MAKFLLIDPSIQDYQGHYFEYAQRVLRAAREAGFDPVMAVHRECQATDVSVRMRPVFRFAFWYTATRSGGHSRTPVGEPRHPRGKALPAQLWYSRWVYHIVAMLRGARILDASPSGWRHLPAITVACIASLARLSGAIAKSIVPYQALLSRVAQSPGGYVRRVAEECGAAFAREALFAKRIFGRRGLLATWTWQSIKRRQFARDTESLLQLDPMQDGDVALVPVASIVELQAFEQLYRRRPDDLRGTWHLVFRHALHGREAANSYSEQTRGLRNALRRFCENMPAERFHFYTDSDTLTAQYNALGAASFNTLSIPIDATVPRQSARDAESSLRIAYLGDARTEKGYHLLPRLVADVFAHPTLGRSASFAIQSNFNLPSGSPETIVARAELQAWPTDRVSLLTEALSPDAYREHLLSADVALLPYDAAAYFARSSGIFAEALAAGIPVVVPAGTWMARQLAASHAEYHQSLLAATALDDALNINRDEASLAVGERKSFQRQAPAGANEVLVHVSMTAEVASTQFVKCRVEHLNEDGRVLRRKSYVLGGDEATCLVRLHRHAKQVRVTLRNAYSLAPLEINTLQCSYLRSAETPPRGAVGVCFQRPSDLARATLEVLRHYEHYRATALAFAPQWREQHDPARLVQAIRPKQSVAATVPAPHFLRLAEQERSAPRW